MVGHLGQIFIQNFVAGDDDSRSDRLQVEIKDIKLYSLNCTQLAGRDNAGPEVNRTFCPPSGLASVNSQEEAHFYTEQSLSIGASKPTRRVMNFLQQGHTHSNKATPPSSITSYGQ